MQLCSNTKASLAGLRCMPFACIKFLPPLPPLHGPALEDWVPDRRESGLTRFFKVMEWKKLKTRVRAKERQKNRKRAPRTRAKPASGWPKRSTACERKKKQRQRANWSHATKNAFNSKARARYRKGDEDLWHELFSEEIAEEDALVEAAAAMLLGTAA
jgi:hypothetical protein